jgi:hypothetical protein
MGRRMRFLNNILLLFIIALVLAIFLAPHDLPNSGKAAALTSADAASPALSFSAASVASSANIIAPGSNPLFLAPILSPKVAATTEKTEVRPITTGSLGPRILFRFANWTKGGFGSIALLNGATFKNVGDRPAKDFLVHCDWSAESGTALGASEQVVYRSVAPGRTLQAGQINMGFVHRQATSANCELSGFETD